MRIIYSYLKPIGRIMAVALLSLAIFSCDGDDNYEPEDPASEINHEYKWLYDNLYNTSWKLQSTNVNYSQSAYKKWGNAVISFSSEEYVGTNITTFKFYISGFGSCGYWYIEDNGNLSCVNSFYVAGSASNVSASDAGLFGNMYGSMIGQKVSFIGTETMIITDNKYKDTWTYTKTSYQNGNSGSSGNGSGNSQYESPEIGFYDFTATKTSITPIFKIYNKTECGGVTSATIYYGTSTTSSSVTATVSGEQIRATITGLKSGTKYNIKCTAKSPGGSTTTSTVSCITNF